MKFDNSKINPLQRLRHESLQTVPRYRKFAKCVDCGRAHHNKAQHESYTRRLARQGKTRQKPATHCVDCGISFEIKSKYRHHARCVDCGQKYQRAKWRQYAIRREANKVEKKFARKIHTQTQAECQAIWEACK